MTHLTQVALAEWARRRSLRSAPESKDVVERHLVDCESCRRTLAAYEALERKCDPWFAAGSDTRGGGA